MSSVARATRGVVRIAVLALAWGATFLWIKLALQVLSPVQVTLARCVLGTAVLAVLCLRSGRRLPRGYRIWRYIFVAALFCNALPFAMFSLGEQTVGSGLAGVLNATTPLWSLLIGVAIGSERSLRPARVCGLLFGFGGVVVIFAPWENVAHVGWGAVVIAAAAASYAIGFAYMGRNLVGKGYATISLSTAQLMAATVLSALTLPFGGLAVPHVHTAGLVAVIILGVFSTGITFHLTYLVIADEGATNAAVVGYLLPVVSLVLGVAVLHEPLSVRVVLGMVIVLVSVGVIRRKKPDPAGPAAPEPSPGLATPARG